MRTNVAVDSSALVKLVLVEDGSELAREVWREADVIVASGLARVESSAALGAARRDRRLRAPGAARARGALETLWKSVVVRELSESIEDRATRLAWAHPLSGADAVHLAVALDTAATLLTWDRRLAVAALAEGLPVLP